MSLPKIFSLFNASGWVYFNLVLSDVRHYCMTNIYFQTSALIVCYAVDDRTSFIKLEHIIYVSFRILHSNVPIVIVGKLPDTLILVIVFFFSVNCFHIDIFSHKN